MHDIAVRMQEHHHVTKLVCAVAQDIITLHIEVLTLNQKLLYGMFC